MKCSRKCVISKILSNLSFLHCQIFISSTFQAKWKSSSSIKSNGAALALSKFTQEWKGSINLSTVKRETNGRRFTIFAAIWVKSCSGIIDIKKIIRERWVDERLQKARTRANIQYRGDNAGRRVHLVEYLGWEIAYKFFEVLQGLKFKSLYTNKLK